MDVIRRSWTLVARTRNGRVVNGLAITALGGCIAHVVLANTREAFSHGAAIGDLANELSIAYLAAWIFNLLVVETPRQRDRATAISFGGQLIRQLVGCGRGIATAMLTEAGTPLAKDDAPIDRLALATAASKLNPTGAAPMVVRRPDGTLLPVTWLAFMEDWRIRKDQRAATVLPLLHLFDTPLAERVTVYNNHPFWYVVSASSSLHPGNADLSTWADSLCNLLEAGDRVVELL